jgi:hypothetical protein
LHRDIKSPNLMLDEQHTVIKVCKSQLCNWKQRLCLGCDTDSRLLARCCENR